MPKNSDASLQANDPSEPLPALLRNAVANYLKTRTRYNTLCRISEQPSFSMIEGAKIAIADALLVLLRLPTKTAIEEMRVAPFVEAEEARHGSPGSRAPRKIREVSR
jgi:hypothetical protein